MFSKIDAININWINKVIGGTSLIKAIFLKKIENDSKIVTVELYTNLLGIIFTSNNFNQH